MDDLGVPAARLLYLGESLGAAVVTELATEYPAAGLVLRSPFVSLTAAAALVPAGVHEVPGAQHNDAELAHGPLLVRAVVELANRVASPT